MRLPQANADAMKDVMRRMLNLPSANFQSTQETPKPSFDGAINIMSDIFQLKNPSQLNPIFDIMTPFIRDTEVSEPTGVKAVHNQVS